MYMICEHAYSYIHEYNTSNCLNAHAHNIYERTHIHTHIHTCTHTYTHVHTHTHTHARTHTHTHTHTQM